MKILLVLTPDLNAETIAAGLAQFGWTPVIMQRGWQVEQLVSDGGLDAILIGAALADALRVVETVRSSKFAVAIMATGSHIDLDRKRQLYVAGCDDVLDCRVKAEEISMRTYAVVRRINGHRDRAIRFGDLTIVPGEQAEIKGRRVPLTKREFAMLEFLALRAGRLVDRQILLAALYGDYDQPELTVVSVLLSKLRRKIMEYGISPELIGTVWGVGWILPKPFGINEPMPSHGAEVLAIRKKVAAGRPSASGCAA